MPLSKEVLSDVVRPIARQFGGELVWSSTLESAVSIKLRLPAGAGDAQFDAAAGAIRRALDERARAEGSRMDSLLGEFVDDAGKVVASRRFGGLKAAPPAAQPAPSGSASSGGGHNPIGGLAPPTAAGLPGVKHVIAVGAGKGGVGKSTVSLNLAVGLARRGHAIGLLDGDIYGPSMPTMLGLDAMEANVLGGMLQPFLVHGVKCMTIGKLVDPEKPLIWRGPMAHGAFKQLTEQTNLGELDYMVIDLPPGTGDVSLTMAQMMKLTGAVVVCTPQKVAQDDAVRAARMFQQLGIEVLGVVENMSYFVGDDGKVYDIFGRGGAETMAQRLGVPFLGSIPITMSLRVNSDKGNPTANFEGTDPAGLALRERLDGLVSNVLAQAALASMRSAGARPELKIS